ncbi:hypothetical protein O181_027578 [Austropuccinia psidii MF-1]|uniref:Uncharacterized protein n=1 Tax=Austropuccinia psidii MF-1 TaxID=1389203 RepID=A0A9Q3CPU8_9BASI|nr:hypothetical protein [Austropuccinia psidii MF-1]
MTNTKNSSNSHISLFEIKNFEKLTSLNFITWQSGKISSLGMRNLKEYLAMDYDTIRTGNPDPKQKQTVYFFLVSDLDSESYDKFVIEDNEDLKLIWKSIDEYYASTSAKNISSHFGKRFRIKFPLLLPHSTNLFLSLDQPLSYYNYYHLICLLVILCHRFLNFMPLGFFPDPVNMSQPHFFTPSKFQLRFLQ